MSDKRAFFIGGTADGLIKALPEHSRYIDIPKEPSPILIPNKSLPPVYEADRYFLYPQEVTVNDEPFSLYILQDWTMIDVAEYLITMYIQVLDDQEPELKSCLDSLPN